MLSILFQKLALLISVFTSSALSPLASVHNRHSLHTAAAVRSWLGSVCNLQLSWLDLPLPTSTIAAPTTAAPTTLAPTTTAAAPTVDAGPVDIYVGPEGTEVARQKARDMPVNGSLGPADGGIDPPEITDDLVEATEDVLELIFGRPEIPGETP